MFWVLVFLSLGTYSTTNFIVQPFACDHGGAASFEVTWKALSRFQSIFQHKHGYEYGAAPIDRPRISSVSTRYATTESSH